MRRSMRTIGSRKRGENEMPYSKKRYGTKAKWKKMKRCVKTVSKKSKGVNPFAVCRKSIYGKKKR